MPDINLNPSEFTVFSTPSHFTQISEFNLTTHTHTLLSNAIYDLFHADFSPEATFMVRK